MTQVTIVEDYTRKINLANTPYKNLSKLIPKGNNVIVVDFKNSNNTIVNSIRRTLISEIKMKYLSVSLTDIKSTDPYIIGEVIRNRIEMIPIPQDIDMDDMFSIKVENTTDNYINVLSDDIRFKGISEPKNFINCIPICSINEQCSISVNDITVNEEYGYINSRVPSGRVAYEVINHDMTVPFLNSNPTEFRIEYETSNNINTKMMFRKAIDSIIERLDSIDFGLAVTEFDVYKLRIPNESYTIGHLLSKYVYFAEPTIDHVSSRIPHPSKRECVVDIKHPQAEKLVKVAIDNIKKELLAIRKTF
jgi:DNA-directed RNA polymerase subunit L